MKRKTFYLILVLAIFVCSMVAKKETISKSFSPKKLVVIKTVSGDCIVKKGSNSEIKVKLVYEYEEDCFKPEFLEEGSSLVLKENFEKHSHCHGFSNWTVTVPAKTNIKFASASGNFSLEGVDGKIKTATASGDIKVFDSTGEFDVKTASGDIEVKNLSGDIEFCTASGDVDGENLDGSIDLKTASGEVDCSDLKGKIELKSASGGVNLTNAVGEFDLKCASGGVEAKDIILTGDSEFKCASGDVYVSLKKSAEYEMVLASASGDAVLDYNGNAVIGYFEFTCRVKKGNIKSAFKFDKETVITKYEKDYHLKSFTRKKGSPKIYISTATGTAELRK